jgi:transcriptional regulatory protein RtcR
VKNVVIGFLGTQLDRDRKRRWKPTVSLVAHEGFPVERLEILYDARFRGLAEVVSQEIGEQSPETEVRLVPLDLADPWDFQEVYGKLFDFAQGYGFDEDREQYHVHLTTGTHVAQICWFLLTESRHVPARLIQTGPPRGEDAPPTMDIIDLDLSRYNALQQRFDVLAREYSDLLKGGIGTKNAAYNALIDRIELVASSSDAPILLLGESGTGKTALAERIYELKLQRRRVKGRMVQINCATLRGGNALPTLFGQRRGHTGQAGSERSGLLREADGGVLFLDEIDELGMEEQALLLHAIETGRYYPLGSDYEVTSRFQVIAAANRDLVAMTGQGAFRPDLLSRLNLWSFTLPSLRDRPEDLEPNLLHELDRAEKALGARVGFNADAADAYLRFARDPGTRWPGNFRDLSGSIQRLCTLAPRGRITRAMVDAEVETLRAIWTGSGRDDDLKLLRAVLGEGAEGLDPFDRVQLAEAVRTCRTSASLSAAGRRLFAVSRQKKTSQNDADRLRKYLARFELSWHSVR